MDNLDLNNQKEQVETGAAEVSELTNTDAGFAEEIKD